MRGGVIFFFVIGNLKMFLECRLECAADARRAESTCNTIARGRRF